MNPANSSVSKQCLYPDSPKLSGSEDINQMPGQHCTPGIREEGRGADNGRQLGSYKCSSTTEPLPPLDLNGSRHGITEAGAFQKEQGSVRAERDDPAIRDIKERLEEARNNNLKVSLLGGGYSQGGQTIADGAIQINIRDLNRVINIDQKRKEATVQSGMTWRDLQKALSPCGLSVSAMQSYADFSIGGSLGVNAHGQDVNWNPVSSSVVSMRVLLTDGRHLEVSRTKHPELFKALLGTYGLIGIITEVTLKVLPNNLFNKTVERIETKNYCNHFNKVSRDPSLALHSARVSVNGILWPFHYSLSINYYDTGKLATQEDEKKEPGYTDPTYLNLMKQDTWAGRAVRKLKTTGEYVWFERQKGTITRNQAMGESVEGLKNTVEGTKDILQEYFVPSNKLAPFLEELKSWAEKHSHFKLLNATIRKVNADKDSILPYAPEDRFAVVLFMNLPDDRKSDTLMRDATRELIDKTLALGGRFYLPYALYATQDQVFKAYPEWAELVTAKAQWDKDGMLENQLYQTYFTGRQG